MRECHAHHGTELLRGVVAIRNFAREVDLVRVVRAERHTGPLALLAPFSDSSPRPEPSLDITRVSYIST